MMKLFLILASVLIMGAFFSACDYVAQPYKGQANNNNSATNGNITVITIQPASSVSVNVSASIKKADSTAGKNVLIEDYTGETCGNCPAAGAALESILTGAHAARIVPVAVNAGSFADPTTTYSVDFRTQVATDYDAFFGISGAGNPNGMVNRVGYPQASHIRSFPQWQGLADNIIANDSNKIKLTLSTAFDTTQGALKISARTDALFSLNGSYNIVFLLTEDSIDAPQKDYSHNPNLIAHYWHNHTLRTSANGTWGTAIISGSLAAGKTVIVNEDGFLLSNSYNKKQCWIVAYIYNSTTGDVKYKEVVQSVRVKIL